MKFFLIYLGYGIITLTLQSTWLHDWPVFWLKIDLIFLAIVFLTIKKNTAESFPLVLLLVLLLESVSYAPMGIYLSTYLILFLLIQWSLKQISISSHFSLFIWLVLFNLADQILVRFFIWIFNGVAFFSMTLVLQLIVNVIWNSCLGVLIFPFLEKMHAFSIHKIFQSKKIQI